MKYLLAAGLALLAAATANAADLISPIVKPRILETYQGAGWYYGLHVAAETQKMTVDPGLGGAFAVGGDVGITLGYMWGANGITWQALDTMVSYKNIDGAVPTAGDPVRLNSRWSFTQRFKFGGNPSLLLAMLPNMGTLFPALPAPPAGGVGTAHPYFFGAVHVDDISESAGVDIGRAWRLEGGFGVGIMQQLGRAQNNPNGAQVVMDLSVEYIPPSSAIMFGLPADFIKVKSGRQTRITAAVLF